jgi:hypothetical protein
VLVLWSDVAEHAGEELWNRDRPEALAVVGRNAAGDGHHQSADRRERLGVSERFLTLQRIWE